MSAPMEPETTPEDHRQRALLLADLGRYDEAAEEIAAGLAAAPGEAALLATLARIHLAAEQPAQALAAAERAGASAPAELPTLVVRAMALTDNRRYAEAAQIASEILRTWPEDAYAQRTGAALLSEARNGQEALNAAWSGVRVAPTDGEAHLVLAVVAARLRLFDLAQRAYAEALDLDAAIGDAGRDVGIVRFERRRWARAIETLAEEASLPEPEPPVAVEAGPFGGPPPVSRPTRQVLDSSAESAGAVRALVRYGASGTLLLSVLTAGMSTVSSGGSRVWAGLIGLLVVGAVLWGKQRLGGPVAMDLAQVRAYDPRAVTALYLTLAAPLGLLAYAAVGGLVPLVAGMVLAAVAELLVLTGRRG